MKPIDTTPKAAQSWQKMGYRLLILLAITTSLALGGPLVPEPVPEPLSDANVTTASPTDSPKHGVSLEEKQVADTAAFAAEKVVTQLEVQRDEAWQTARGNLAVATNPPIRSSAVLGMLSAETDKFAQLEASIKKAKDEAKHQRRIAELVGGAWDAAESRKLKALRVQAAEAALAASRVAELKKREEETELLHELEIERQRKVL